MQRAATLLNNGMVLLAGGFVASGWGITDYYTESTF